MGAVLEQGMTQNRVQTGGPAGGQFAPERLAESTIELDDQGYAGGNQQIVDAILRLNAGAVRENFTGGRDDDPLGGVADEVLEAGIAEHRRAIGRAAGHAGEIHEDDAWSELDSICGSIARHAIGRAKSEETSATGGSLSLMEWPGASPRDRMGARRSIQQGCRQEPATGGRSA
jgi:hypothetical protein